MRDAGRVDAAQRLVEAGLAALARVVGGDDADILFILQIVGCQRTQHPFWAGFDENASTPGIQGLHTLHKLNRRCHLAGQQIQNLFASGWIALTGHIGYDRQFGGLDVHAFDHTAQRLASRGDNAGVESVRDRDLDRLVTGLAEFDQGLIHSRGGTAQHALHRAVDVGNDDVIGDRLDHLFHHI